ncbi:MAG: helix-turn-helix transcriptional regulator [Planctomycetes bacterium]|nr:helix-turn-helix transcriptional regulator [Planctomycetota bacterium]
MSTPIPHVTVEDARPRVDFSCCWRVDAEQRHVYRVPSHQFLFIESGRVYARTSRGECWAGPGELLCLKREPRNEYGYTGPTCYWEAHVTFVPPPRQALPLWLEGQPIPDRIVLGEHAPAVRTAFDTWCRELDRPGDLPRLRVLGALNDLLAAVTMALGREPSRRARADPWQRVRARLEGDFGAPLTVADLAAELNIGEDHVIRAFRRRFGLSPMAFRAQAKLRWASRELAEGRPVKEVAHQLGFADASAFARAFRRHFGVAPSDLHVAGMGTAPKPLPATDELSFPMNRHIQPPGATSPWFIWG